MSFLIEIIVVIIVICVLLCVSLWGAFRFLTYPVAFYYDEYGIFTPKPAKVKDGKLLIYKNALRIKQPEYTVIIEDAPHYPFRTALGNYKPCYFVHYHHLKPLVITIKENTALFDFMSLKTLQLLLDNKGVENLATAIDRQKNPMVGAFIILAALVVLLAIGYFLFVAPNSMSTEACANAMAYVNASASGA